MPIDIFDEAVQQRKELHAIFDTLPETTIYGVVANGPSGGRVPPETCWSLHLDLIAWRIPGAPVTRAQLSVTKQVSDAELTVLQQAIHSESIVAFRVKLCENSPFGDTRAKLISLLDRPIDEELESILSEYLKPVELTDPVVGKLTLNRSVDDFEGNIAWVGKQIGLKISVYGGVDPLDSLRTAKVLLANMETWAARVNDYAVAKLLELKNDSWLDEGERHITREEFIRRMHLESITVYPEGKFEFWHNDGDLFWGHSILVSGSLSEGLTDADIPG
jgi:hypothetical protein